MQAGGDEECAVCLNELFDPVITQCAHVYCRRCIETVIVQVTPAPKRVSWQLHSSAAVYCLHVIQSASLTSSFSYSYCSVHDIDLTDEMTF